MPKRKTKEAISQAGDAKELMGNLQKGTKRLPTAEKDQKANVEAQDAAEASPAPPAPLPTYGLPETPEEAAAKEAAVDSPPGNLEAQAVKATRAPPPPPPTEGVPAAKEAVLDNPTDLVAKPAPAATETPPAAPATEAPPAGKTEGWPASTPETMPPPPPTDGVQETEQEAAAKEAAVDAVVAAPQAADDGDVGKEPATSQEGKKESGVKPSNPEQPASIEKILDKQPLSARIKDALTLVDRVDRQKLCKELAVPIPEFDAAVNELIEAKEIKEDAISTPQMLYLPLSEKERKEHKGDLAKAKGHDRFLAIERIHDNRTYREDYRSWDDFLHFELGYENPHDWWEREKRRVRIQQCLDEHGIKMQIPLTKYMADHLNRVRDDAGVFVACVTEFQKLPKDRQKAKRLGEIVQRHLNGKNKLASLRQFKPDATAAEVDIMAPIYAADHRWKVWYPRHTEELHARVESGRPIRDCMMEMVKENKTLPTDKVLLEVARGGDLLPLVNDLMRLKDEWQRQYEEEERRKKWLAEGKALKLYDPNTGMVIEKPEEEAKPKAATRQFLVQGPNGRSIVAGENKAPPPDDEPGDPLYPEGIDFHSSIIVWAEQQSDGILDPTELLGIATEAATIAFHRAKTGEWDEDALRKLAVTAKQALNRFTEVNEPPAVRDSCSGEQDA